MRERSMSDSLVLKRLDFPAYCVKLLDNGLVAIAGGGGTSKTGVTNWIEIGHVTYTSTSDLSSSNNNTSKHQNFNTEFRLVAKLETADAIMKFVCFSSPHLSPSQSDLFIAAALNDHIEIYRIQPRVQTTSNNSNNTNNHTNDSSHHESNSGNQVRQRKTSSSSSSKVTQNGSAHKEKSATAAETSRLEASAELKLVTRLPLHQHDSEKSTPDESIVSLQVYKSRSGEETVMLCAGTSAGSIVVWHLEFEANNNLTSKKINIVPVQTFKKAHGTSEIDDLQVNADGDLLSIGKDNKAVVWSLRKLAKLADLEYGRYLPDSNLRMKHARFSHDSNYLYTTYIPRVRNGTRNLFSYVHKWHKIDIESSNKGSNHFGYQVKCMFRLPQTIITSIQTSRDGHFVAIGDCDGKIYLFDENFNQVKSFKKSHSSVVTDLIFYHDCELLRPTTSRSSSPATTPSGNNNNNNNNNKPKSNHSSVVRNQPTRPSASSSSLSPVYDLNKLILTISIDRTIQLYKFINTSSRLITDLTTPPSSAANSLLTCCLSMKLFQFCFALIVFFLLFCYFFTYIE